jgi:hypothetical protein
MSEFFLGERAIDQFTVPFYGGKATLSCDVVERWESILSLSISCGTVMKRSLTQRCGVSLTEHEDLEAAVKSSIGVPHLAELGSKIKSSAGRELHLERSREETQEFKFEAPKCGRLVKNLFQKVRRYSLTYNDDRFLHHANWSKPVFEWLADIHEESRGIENDPSCGCSTEPKLGFDGLLDVTAGSRISLSVPYVFSRDKKSLTIPELELTIKRPKGDKTSQMLSARSLPAHLRFVADENSNRLRCRFNFVRNAVSIWNPATLVNLRNAMGALKVLTNPSSDSPMLEYVLFTMLRMRIKHRKTEPARSREAGSEERFAAIWKLLDDAMEQMSETQERFVEKSGEQQPPKGTAKPERPLGGRHIEFEK